MRTHLTIFFVLLLCFISNAQTTFQKAYGSGDGAFNNKYDHAGAIYQTADGGYILNARIGDWFISEKFIKL